MYISEFKGKFRCFKQTEHFKTKRGSRRKMLLDQLPKGKLIGAFYVDRDHENGAEIHYIFSNGVITIVNAKTKNLITKLIARPHQILRYYKACNLEPPKDVLGQAFLNTGIKHMNK